MGEWLTFHSLYIQNLTVEPNGHSPCFYDDVCNIPGMVYRLQMASVCAISLEEIVIVHTLCTLFLVCEEIEGSGGGGVVARCFPQSCSLHESQN